MSISFTFLGPVLRLIEAIRKPLTRVKRNKELSGFYLVCPQNSSIPFKNSPDGTPNFLTIKTNSFHDVDTLTIVSKDYDSTYTKKWKTWKGKIKMDSDEYGKGYYNYVGSNEPGDHEIWLIEPGVIRVRVTDKGKAHLKERRDNDPATQQWLKLHENDPLIPKLLEMLSFDSK